MSESSPSLGAGLAGRGVIVTGAAGGIGRAVTRSFASAGARVMGVDLGEEAISASIADCPGEGHLAVAADLIDVRVHESLIARARAEFGEVYVLVHTAAVLVRRDIEAVTENEWDLQLDTNLKATFFLCRAAATAMVDQGVGGRIITFASQGWWTGGFGASVVYAASKGGVVSMSRGFARRYGPHQITVNSIAPGLVNTSMLLADLDSEVADRLRQDTPLGFFAEPDDIAGVVVFLASDHARYISGATVNVSGAALMY